MNIEMSIDIMWVLLAGALVFFMNLGFAWKQLLDQKDLEKLRQL